MKSLLTQLYAREPLSRSAAYEMLSRVGNGAASDMEIAAVVSAINMRPNVLSEIQGFRDAMLELAHPIDLGGLETIDIVGTGGDGKDTFNVSTLSSFVVAGAGYPVTKHGSYGVSSSVGSSDVLVALGVNFTNNQSQLLATLDRAGICFFHAPLFHPAMKNVVPVRKGLKVRSFFNLLGPLLNPARPAYSLLGTYDRQVARVYDYILQDAPRQAYTIVHALDGYDEISLTGPAAVRSRTGSTILEPGDFGFDRLAQRDLYGGSTAEAGKKIFLSVLDNTATIAQRNVVCANAGLAIRTIHPERSLTDCVAEAAESLASGNARGVLKRLL
ncbi:anthranilate phosphoribosyltransferase [Neolewinella antarctica]|uniref:Anthranilate phosphoribosyltransferase n=1 Tax=Neolewinella antarctica TaxID=442734 RepID=A0ABX0X7U3_9BACT|nr:anthranilate phosphoribosyltransferase [Neolewinella antarctica]NJC25305.1 anthranilate phosphoribosyltransferase [Neolewinella antarctica]